MKIAFSPCPNDTFIFHAWVHGLVAGAPKLEVRYADIDITNGLATSGDGPDIIKMSYAALPWVLSEYALLPCGGALGRGCGPLVLTKENIGGTKDLAVLTGQRVAVPSERSTAYLLFRLWAAQNVPGGVMDSLVGKLCLGASGGLAAIRLKSCPRDVPRSRRGTHQALRK